MALGLASIYKQFILINKRMKKTIVLSFLLLVTVPVLAQYGNQSPLIFNPPYASSNNRSVILSSDRIPSDFLGCTLGVTTEVDALKKLSKLGIRYRESSGGDSDVLVIDGDIECEGAKFLSVALWFYSNRFWKIVLEHMKTDSKVLANTIKQKYSKFPRTAPNKYGYIRYIGNSTDLVHNNSNLQYTIRGGSSVRWGEE